MYNNNITSLDEYIGLAEEWIELKERKLIKRKDIRKMINKDELIYKLETIIEYLKNNGGYDYEVYNRLCPGMGEPDLIY